MRIVEVVSTDDNGEGLSIPMSDDISSSTDGIRIVSEVEGSEECVSSARAGEMGNMKFVEEDGRTS